MQKVSRPTTLEGINTKQTWKGWYTEFLVANYKQPEGERWTVLELHSLCSVAVNFSWGFTLILLSVIVPIIANSVSTFSKSSLMKGA